jgi:hypothetical protein
MSNPHIQHREIVSMTYGQRQRNLASFDANRNKSKSMKFETEINAGVIIQAIFLSMTVFGILYVYWLSGWW